MSTDQITEQAIPRLVDEFYLKVRANPDLGPIFARAIPGDWEAHLATMRNFWSSVMLTSGRYKGNPVAVHQRVEGIERMRSWAMVGQAGRTTSTSATDSFFQGTASSGGRGIGISLAVLVGIVTVMSEGPPNPLKPTQIAYTRSLADVEGKDGEIFRTCLK